MRNIFLFACIALFTFALAGCENSGIPSTANTLNDINQKVASDAVTQYNIAKRSGTPMDACVQAGLVAAAYLQAQDESSYRQWKATQSSDCAAAGVPQ